MKRFALLIIIVIATTLLAIDGVYTYVPGGRMVLPGQLHTEHAIWEVAATTLSAGDEPNDLAVDERTYLTAVAAAEGGDSKITVLDLRTPIARHSWNRLRFRCIGIADNNDVTYQIYTGTLTPQETDCALVKSGQLAFTVGLQESTTATYEFADTLTVTEYCTPLSWLSTTPGSDLVAEAYIDLAGDDIVVIVPTTVSCNCKLLVKGL